MPTKTDTASPTRTVSEAARGITLTTALRAVWPHASRDKSFRLLMGVELAGNRVIATDRYSAGRAEFDPETLTSSGTGDSLWLRPELVKFILANKADPITHLDATLDRITVGFESGTTFGVDALSALDVGAPTYPNLDRIFTEWKATPDRAVLRFTSQYLNRVADTNFPFGSATYVEIGTSPAAGPQLRITKGEHPWFTALLAEVRS